MEVNSVPPPVPVAAMGLLRVALKIGNGQCHSKGCVEGEQHRSCIKMSASAEFLCTLKVFVCRRGSV